MSFSSHIDRVTLKATRMLNFIKRNLYKCNKEIKCIAYLSLVQPSLEYAASAWDPYLIKDITAIEKIQRRAVRWVTSNYMTGEMVLPLHQHLLTLLNGPLLLSVGKYPD